PTIPFRSVSIAARGGLLRRKRRWTPFSGAALFPQAAPHAVQNRQGSKKGARKARAPLRSVDFDDDLFIAPRRGGAHNDADRLCDAPLLADHPAHVRFRDM